MTKHNTVFVGIDLGDKHSEVCVMNEQGDIVARDRIATSSQALHRYFGAMAPARIAIEVGTHSPWISRLLESLGHQVLAANPRKVRLIYRNPLKSDRVDAQWLARLVRFDASLLSPIHHRSAQAQKDLAVLRSRDVLVRTRAGLVNHVRGLVKASGGRLHGCSTASFHNKVSPQLPVELLAAVEPVLSSIATLTQQIRSLERTIEQLLRRYPHARVLMQVHGVGPLTAMCYVLTVEDPNRFRRNRAVGCYLGLVPKRDQSGQRDPQMRITKAGDSHLRRLLVQCAQYILGPFGKDSDLRRFGLQMATRGGNNAKKRAVVAVARRLAVLLLSLWKTGEVYEPLRHAQAQQVKISA